ncbi:hypothetical protein BGX28_004747 [Mortierella sp. GBA30]|nr:hypothetical protein BGX28_004747 [Mortierella sp. GBA30]
MKVLVDAEKHRLAGQQLRDLSLSRPSLLADPSEPKLEIVQQKPTPFSNPEQPPQKPAVSRSEKQSVPVLVPPSPSTPVPVLTIVPPTAVIATDSCPSSASSSPTTSTASSSGSSLDQEESISFSFCSPLFYDQKLYIYRILLALYQILGRCIEQHPAVLLMLQYSIATIHGITVYLLSVILSLAQLIMITFTLENLDWIQSHSPLMHEWDSRFPGFVFPALDIDSSESEEDESSNSIPQRPSRYQRKKNSQYWSAQATLKGADDLVDDGYQSEEYQQRWTIRHSMNSTLRKRLAKYQQWVPLFWNAEENSIQEELEAEDEEDEDEAASMDTQDTQDRRSSRLRRALVRTLSGNVRPISSKRVTFNEQVLVFGRRRSSQASQFSVSSSVVSSSSISMEPVHAEITVSYSSVSQGEDVHMRQSEDKQSDISSGTRVSKNSDHADIAAAIVQEDEAYQRQLASEDINGPGISSPSFKPDHPHSLSTPTCTAPTLPSPPGTPSANASPLSPPSAGSTPSSPVAATSVKDTRDLKRSISVPLKIGSFLHRHHHHPHTSEPLQSTPRHSATFSESSTVSQNPRTLPPHLATLSTPLQEVIKTDAPSSPGTSMSLGLRARRSLSLGLPRPHSHPNAAMMTAEGRNDIGASLERQGSTGRKNNKNFIYRIVHPQRYKRELEQQLTEQERQRLLTLAHLQRQRILAMDDDESSSPESPTAGSMSRQVLCGDVYYYATSAEYIQDLGAPNSMISTSYGTSFPHELQRNNKSRFKSQPRPASYDFEYLHQPLPVHAIGCGYGSEGDNVVSVSLRTFKSVAPAKELSPQASHRGGLFKRENKKKSNNDSELPRTQSPSRLNQLFKHPGHRQTQSTSSLIQPPGSHSVNIQAATAATETSNAGNGATTTAPIFSSSAAAAAAGAHRLLTRARSNSRAFTSFTALGVPANPSAQILGDSNNTILVPPASVPAPTGPVVAIGGVPRLSSRDPGMEHTTFAAFGFPSPSPSPQSSAPASPRHSTSCLPTDAMSHGIATMNDFQANLVCRQVFAESEYGSQAIDGALAQVQSQQHQHHQQFQQEMLLDQEDSLAENEGLSDSGSTQDSSFSKCTDTLGNEAVTRPNRGLSFIRKLSLKKKK